MILNITNRKYYFRSTYYDIGISYNAELSYNIVTEFMNVKNVKKG